MADNMLLSKRQVVRLTDDESEFLKTIAGRYKWSVAELIRHAIKDFIRRQEKAQDKTCEKQT